jgi:hypothetical protein
MYQCVDWYILTDVSEYLTASIPEESHLHTRGSGNIKSHLD